MKKPEKDKRTPELRKVGCYTYGGDLTGGFTFFLKEDVCDGDVFVYNKGILWKLDGK
jgi:hypothetical protein